MDINDLYIKSKNGDKTAEKQLFKHLSVSFKIFALQRIMNKQDAEEVVQNSLMILSNKYKVLDNQPNFAAFAYKVLKNQLMAYYKSKRLPKNSNQSLMIDYASKYDENYTNLKLRLFECIKKIHGINKSFARILNLHYQGYSTDEICEKMLISRSNFYTTLYRARIMLKTCIEKGEIN
ncbi:MAG: sigma-70 family RNA polymerase sigma factor [candidate division Zixibacteria bacterium]|nr:sigma-70 family RNA polymerase sigma factor [candidate division Zixibacteria bacterium]